MYLIRRFRLYIAAPLLFLGMSAAHAQVVVYDWAVRSAHLSPSDDYSPSSSKHSH